MVGSSRSRSGRAMREPVTMTSWSSSLEAAGLGLSWAFAPIDIPRRQGAASKAPCAARRDVPLKIISKHPLSH